MNWTLPLFECDFGEAEVKAVEQVIRSGWLTMGTLVRKFEEAFAARVGCRHAIAVSSCTAALHLAQLALEMGPEDEVICPALTFVATANAIRYVGARPVFADVKSRDEWVIGVEQIQTVESPRTKGVCAVHYAGYPCAMDEISAYARARGLKVIEDCAHAPLTLYKGKALGTWGDIGCFSFFSNKNLSTGEGGMLVTDDDEIASRLRLLRSHGMTTLTLDRHQGHAFSYDVVAVGFNYRPTEITAALGLVQLEKLEGKNEQRRTLVTAYRNQLAKETPALSVPFGSYPLEFSACHIMPVLLPPQTERRHVMEGLRQEGIQSSIHYPPIHTFQAYAGLCPSRSLPHTELIGAHCLTLPLYPQMIIEDVDRCVKTLAQLIEA
ncbi:DegT/DnrJ/EryC1/StrS family aminotransferase [Desulforhabdus amnigena]|uniref:Aminotransferase DegT n=1 Tax=Desulforhabdus amnigena TaxID=40218 RepID=A0A9W6FVY6_9BACT|nr:DegT/DnrJ/EryC1/StrS aminotransferase family protein [Desulforhabdus amnigena]GLI35891.1 aminotransferase DegT [Desulforhabdus amnigena]